MLLQQLMRTWMLTASFCLKTPSRDTGCRGPDPGSRSAAPVLPPPTTWSAATTCSHKGACEGNPWNPAACKQVDKAGADVLFKDPKLKSTDLGVTVNAIRIKRLEQLGDVTAAGERLLNAERKKVLSFLKQILSGRLYW